MAFSGLLIILDEGWGVNFGVFTADACSFGNLEKPIFSAK
jgi:hypothetical protein